MLETLAPAAFLVVIVLVHAGYVAVATRAKSQMSIASASRHLEAAGAAKRLEGHGLLIGERSSKRAREALAAPEVREPVVCSRDLLVNDSARFPGPLKVRGDLRITGCAVFEAPVTVVGGVQVEGEAAFEEGIVASQDVVVLGSMRLGSAARAGWLVARNLIIDGGELMLNGRVDVSGGVYRVRPPS